MFKKVIIPIIAISTMIFAGFSTLLAKYGSERIKIQLDNQDFVYGEVRDFISPGMGAFLSIMLCAAAIVVIGYVKSLRRQNKLEKQLFSLRRAISDTEAQIQELKNLEQINN